MCVKKNTKRKVNYSRLIDLVFMLVYIIAVLFGFIALKQINFLSGISSFIYLLIAFLILYLFFKSSLKKHQKGFVFLKRFVLMIIVIALFSTSLILQAFKTSFDSLSDTTNKMYLITTSSTYPKTIGIQSGSDHKKSSFFKETLMDDFDADIYEASNYDELFDALHQGNIDAILISNAYYLKYESENPSFHDTYSLLKLYQYQEDQPNELPEVFSVYLSGIDTMGSPDQLTRSDTNLLLVVDSIRNRMTLISIPRDAYLPNPALEYQNDKFTHTALYGIDTSIETLENFFQIPINYYARISFQSLISIVDCLDGIEVDVEIDFCEQDENRSFKQEDLICLSAGKQILDGKQALAYSRHRKTAGYDNAGRERAQKRIIKAMIEKATSPTILLKISDLLNEMNTYLMTNISTRAITSFISSEFNDLSDWEITSISTNKGVYDYQYCASNDPSLGTSSVYLYSERELKAIQDVYYGSIQDIDFNHYSFDLNDINSKDIYQDEVKGEIIWSSMAQFPH